jgi:hypothetical protein
MMDMPEANDDDVARMACVRADLARRTIAALRRAPIRPGTADARSVRRLAGVEAERMSEADHELLRMLAWRWRRALPPVLAPKLPPHDPVVAAMEGRAPSKDLAHGR